jgi:hypothetical protein
MKILVAVLSLLLPVIAGAQTCTTATCTASSASEAAVMAALPSSSNTNATVVVNIPAGTGSWTSNLIYTIPSAVTNLTIQGASTLTWTGTAGTSSWNYSANDQTIIQDAWSDNNTPLLSITTNGASTLLRLTGLTIEETTGAIQYNGVIVIGGGSNNVRLDHLHITGSGKQNVWFQLVGRITGVADHNAIDENPNNSNGDNTFRVFAAPDDPTGEGDGSWINGPKFGTLAPFYMESNYWNGGLSNDCTFGGRFVSRYNTFNDMYVPVQTHGTKSSGGPDRGCIGYEAYNNYLLGSTSSPSSSGFGGKGGTALIFNNTMANGYYRLYESVTDRNGGDNAPETNPPNGWGYCGTQSLNPSTGSANGVGSAWDGTGTSATGYPCLDGIGRGQDTQELNGQVFPNRLNTVTGTIAWPHQYLMPVYMWNNSIGSATYAIVTGDTTANTTNNLDYYYDQTAQSGSFTGAAGTGHGLLSARPTSCTAGPGGTYGTSPTGSYGVAYWATDANGGKGELYVCTASGSPGTWTAVYQPLAFPHPLVSGSAPPTSTTTGLSSSNLTPPSGTNITLTAPVTPSSGPTGSVTFFDGGSSMGTGSLSSGSAVFTVLGITAGTHIYTATYGGDSSYSSSTSSAATVAASGPSGSIVTPGTSFKGGVVIQ